MYTKSKCLTRQIGHKPCFSQYGKRKKEKKKKSIELKLQYVYQQSILPPFSNFSTLTSIENISTLGKMANC